MLPAPVTASSPMLRPGKMMAPPPTQMSQSPVIACPHTSPPRRYADRADGRRRREALPADLDASPDRHWHHLWNNAAEVPKHAGTDPDGPVGFTVERRPALRSLTGATEPLP